MATTEEFIKRADIEDRNWREWIEESMIYDSKGFLSATCPHLIIGHDKNTVQIDGWINCNSWVFETFTSRTKLDRFIKGNSFKTL